MICHIAADIAKLSPFIACAYALQGVYARRQRLQWTEHLTTRRLAVRGLLTLAVGGIKLIKDVVAKESGPVDETILWFVREHVPAALNGFLAALTFSGSAPFLVPVAVVAAVALLVALRRFEAVLAGASPITTTLVVWAMKAIVGRARPALWDAQWYCGASFPSGHTLSTAAFATATALCLAHIWPRAGTLAWRLPWCGQAWSPSPVSCLVSTGRRMCSPPCAWVRSSLC